MTPTQFTLLVRAMRRAQRIYNRQRSVTNLLTVEALENTVDLELAFQAQRAKEKEVDPAEKPLEATSHAQ